MLDSKIVYRRYASLFFIAGCASTDNELITLEIVHRYVEQMDKYYGNVCEVSYGFWPLSRDGLLTCCQLDIVREREEHSNLWALTSIRSSISKRHTSFWMSCC
jgi:hypothetical protein